MVASNFIHVKFVLLSKGGIWCAETDKLRRSGS